MSGSAFAVTHHAFSSGAGRTSDGNGSHASTLKSPSYTKSVSWQHYQNPSLGMGDWRFFISEPEIISVEDLPPGWGLLHVVNGRVRKVHGWPRGNCCWGNPDDKPFTGNKQVECDYMLSALRRMELRGHLNEIYDGVIVNKKEGNAA
ncbi:hypothetical protein [Escherichia coli]|uniref:hypothetical protein n=1 Tax=Escherichia coli TaxID=562 RepID=UPI001FCD6995|nr:hypothetical protein [Escherichia coli]